MLGVALGVGSAIAAVSALGSLGLEVIAIPWPVVGGTALAALVLGVIGAWIPAVRAARSGIMDAIGGGPEARSAVHSGTMVRFLSRLRSPKLEDETTRSVRSYGASFTPGAEPDTAGAPGTTEDTEHPMSARCYNCGNEPGTGDDCQVCGATQIPEPVGMFSTSPLAEAVVTPARTEARHAPSMPGAGLWSRGEGTPDLSEHFESEFDQGRPETNGSTNGSAGGPANHEPAIRYADIVDAAVIEDDDEPYEPPPAAPVAATGPQPLGSIFDGMEAAGSPFARHANDEDEFPPDVEERSTPQWSAPWASAAPAGAPLASPPLPAYTAPPAPAPSVPPRPNSAMPNGAVPNGAVPNGTMPNGASDRGLSVAVNRLSPASRESGAVAFTVAGALIEADEAVLTSVAGWSLGLPTVAVLTTSRILVVSERRYTPVVEVFALRPSLTIYGRHLDNAATITFQDNDRVLTVDQIPDIQLAVELATAARSRTTGTGF